MKRILTVLILTSMSILSVHFALNAQQQELTPQEQKDIELLRHKPFDGFFGISFTNCVPQKQFQDNLKKTGQGLSVFGGWYADPIPVSIGLNADILFNGSSEERNINIWKDSYNVTYIDHDTISTQSMLIPIHVFARMQPNMKGNFFPYLETFIGLTVLDLSYDYKSGLNNDQNNINVSEHRTNAAFNYGASVGVMYKLADFINLPSTHTAMLADIRLKYIIGETTYYWKGEILNHTAYFTELKSKTDMIILQIGLTFMF